MSALVSECASVPTRFCYSVSRTTVQCLSQLCFRFFCFVLFCPVSVPVLVFVAVSVSVSVCASVSVSALVSVSESMSVSKSSSASPISVFIVCMPQCPFFMLRQCPFRYLFCFSVYFIASLSVKSISVYDLTTVSMSVSVCVRLLVLCFVVVVFNFASYLIE